jgi:hypothetical protein
MKKINGFFGLILFLAACSQIEIINLKKSTPDLEPTISRYEKANPENGFTPIWDESDFIDVKGGQVLVLTPLHRNMRVTYGIETYFRRLVTKVDQFGTPTEASRIIEINSFEKIGKSDLLLIMDSFTSSKSVSIDNGVIVTRDINLESSAIAIYIDQKNLEFDKSFISPSQGQKFEKNVRQGNGGNCVDWYLITHWSDGSTTEDYLYTTCDDCMYCIDNGGTPGDGSSDVSGDIQLDEDDEYTCPRNFSFSSVTTNNLWQEGALTNVYCDLAMTKVGSTSSLTIRKVEIPILYFGLPFYNVEGNLIYSEEEAAVIATNALNFGEADMRQKFKENPGLTSIQLGQIWLERTQYHMGLESINRGRVNKNGSINPSNTVPKRAYDPCI